MSRLYLEVLTDAERRDVELADEGRTYRVGRHPDCELRLSSVSVARHHLAIVRSGDQVWARALLGGFSLNQRHQGDGPVPLEVDDVLSVGTHCLRLSLRFEPRPLWLAAEGGQVARLARQVARRRQPDVLRFLRAALAEVGWAEAVSSPDDLFGVLADALEEAGCGDAGVLAHLRRNDRPHLMGCSVVDCLLGAGG